MKKLQDTYVTAVTDFTTRDYKFSKLRVIEVLDKIKNGGHSYSDLINKVRQIKSVEGKSDRYKETRKPVLGICFNTTFSSTRRLIADAIPNNLMYIDIDDVSLTKEEILALPIGKHIIALWKSIGGDGFGGIISYTNATKNQFKDLYAQVNVLTNGLLDKQCNDVTRPNYLSYDEDMYTNYNAVPFEYKVNDLFNKEEKVSLVSNKRKKVSLVSNTPSSSLQLPTNDTFLDKRFRITDAQLYVNPNEEYTIFEDGVDTIKTYFPKWVKKGNRRNVFLAYFTNFFYLNPHLFSYEYIRTTVATLSSHCEGGMMDEKKIQGIYMTLKKQIDTNTLEPLESGLKVRKIIFNENSKMTKNEKQSIVAEEIGKMRSKKTRDKIDEFFGDEICNLNSKVTYKVIADTIGVSVPTIKRKFKDNPDYKQALKEHNEQYLKSKRRPTTEDNTSEVQTVKEEEKVSENASNDVTEESGHINMEEDKLYTITTKEGISFEVEKDVYDYYIERIGVQNQLKIWDTVYNAKTDLINRYETYIKEEEFDKNSN